METETIKQQEEPALTRLSEEELAEPWLVLLWLFDKSSVENLREDVWQYFKAAASEHGWFQMDQPYEAISVKDWLERLMEASWVMLRRKERRDGEIELPYIPADSVARLEDNRKRTLEHAVIQQEHGGSILLLRQRELDNPYLVLKGFFRAMPLEKWKETLTIWTEYALCYTSLIQDTEDMNLVLRYEQFQRLLEASYFITLLMDGEEFELIPAKGVREAAPPDGSGQGNIPAKTEPIHV